MHGYRVREVVFEQRLRASVAPVSLVPRSLPPPFSVHVVFCLLFFGLLLTLPYNTVENRKHTLTQEEEKRTKSRDTAIDCT